MKAPNFKDLMGLGDRGNGKVGKPCLRGKLSLLIRGIKSPIGVTVLAGGGVVVGVTGEDAVKVYDRNGTVSSADS